ncbi:hypothetical protein H5410_035530, partial [Solanum commersonii]
SLLRHPPFHNRRLYNIGINIANEWYCHQGFHLMATIVEGKNQKARIPEQRKTLKRSQLSRSESMDSGVFLLKMFLPASIGSKKKLKTKNYSKVSSKTSVDESEKSVSWLKATAQRGNKEDASFSLAEQIEEYNT